MELRRMVVVGTVWHQLVPHHVDRANCSGKRHLRKRQRKIVARVAEPLSVGRHGSSDSVVAVQSCSGDSAPAGRQRSSFRARRSSSIWHASPRAHARRAPGAGHALRAAIWPTPPRAVEIQGPVGGVCHGMREASGSEARTFGVIAPRTRRPHHFDAQAVVMHENQPPAHQHEAYSPTQARASPPRIELHAANRSFSRSRLVRATALRSRLHAIRIRRRSQDRTHDKLGRPRYGSRAPHSRLISRVPSERVTPARRQPVVPDMLANRHTPFRRRLHEPGRAP